LIESSNWVFSARARRDLRGLVPPSQRRVVSALDHLTGDPPQGEVTRLPGLPDEWRLRVGDWQVRFTRDPDSRRVEVLGVLARRS